MLIQSINNANSFKGEFQVNPLFNKFKEDLNPAQKNIFENIIKKAKKEQDGRVFKFDKVINAKEAGGAEVGIFEKKHLIDRTLWMPLFCSTRERAAWCFDQFNKMYTDIVLTRLEAEKALNNTNKIVK